MPHVNDGLMHEFLDGELKGAARDDVLAHVAECAACRTRLEEERALAARAGELLARVAPVERAPAPFATLSRARALRWRIPAAWAATILIAFGIGRYTQGERERPQHDVAGSATRPELKAPLASNEKTPRRFVERAPIARAPLPRSQDRLARDQDATSQMATPRVAAPYAVAEAAPPRDEAEAWPELDADAARRLLGRAPAVLPGYPVRRMARSAAEDGVVLIEQEWRPGVVLRLFERRAISAGRADAGAQSASPRARLAPSAEPALRGEKLARYINSLRVEIAGPLAADSLAQLLDLVE